MSKLNAETKAVLRDLDAVAPLVKGDPDIVVVRKAYDEAKKTERTFFWKTFWGN